MPTFAHLSDLHFGTISNNRLEQLYQQLEKLAPDHILISGDLTQRATHRQFQQAAAFLRELSAPVFLVPGNHDQPAFALQRFTAPWGRWRRYISPYTEPVADTKDCLLLGINSARQWGWHLDWSRGRIGNRQSTRVCRHLAAAGSQQLRMLVIHHPFWLPPGQQHRKLVGNHNRALATMSRHGLDLIVSGHVHLPYRHIAAGIIIAHAGTSTSSRLVNDHGNSFSVIRGDREHIAIEQYNWLSNHFALELTEHFVRQDDNWHPQPIADSKE